MRHILFLDRVDLDQLFGDGIYLPAGDNVLIRADRNDCNAPPDAIKIAPVDAPSKEYPSIDDRIFDLACPDCNRRFPTQKGLAGHIQVTHKKDFWCKKHGRAFGSATALKKHKELRHGDDVPKHPSHWFCSMCEASFDTENGLKIHHRKKHKSGGNGQGFDFPCTDDDCDKQFATPSARDSHMRNVHGD